MLHKTFDLLETKTDSETGTFEATVAVFGNVDRGGDRIMPGAFKNTLVKWAESGDPIPVILSHQWDNPMAHIGIVDEAKETDEGLWVKGTLDVGDNDVARQVHKLMKRRSLKEFSFGYEIAENGSKRAKDGANELLDLDLAEVGPTLKGMNPATELHAVKSALEAEEAEQTKALREESERRAREVADERIPDLPPAEPAPAEPDVDLLKELQEVKARLETTELALADLKKKTEDTDKGHARSVDPLRKRSEELALEIASDGMSLRKPPPPVAQDKPDPVDADEIKRQSRDWLFEVLSYSTENIT